MKKKKELMEEKMKNKKRIYFKNDKKVYEINGIIGRELKMIGK